jgi:hypothetical protein
MSLSRFAEGFSTGLMLLSMIWRLYTRYPLLREVLWLDGLLVVVYAIHWFHSFCYHLLQTDKNLYLDKLWIGRMIHLRIVRLLLLIDSGIMRGLYAASVIFSLVAHAPLDTHNYLNYALAFVLTTFFAEVRDQVYSLLYLLAGSCYLLGFCLAGVQRATLVVLFHVMLGLKTYREEVFLQKLNNNSMRPPVKEESTTS